MSQLPSLAYDPHSGLLLAKEPGPISITPPGLDCDCCIDTCYDADGNAKEFTIDVHDVHVTDPTCHDHPGVHAHEPHFNVSGSIDETVCLRGSAIAQLTTTMFVSYPPSVWFPPSA
jgi:hypothetical protein